MVCCAEIDCFRCFRSFSDFVNNYDTFHLGPSSNAKCWKIWWQNQCVKSAFCWRTHVEYLHHNITHNLSATRSFTVLLFDTFNFTIDKPSWFITRFPGYPNLLYGTYTQYLLQFCPSQVKTCFGCGQALKSGGELARPPCDLVIVSNAKRAYYNNAGIYQHLLKITPVTKKNRNTEVLQEIAKYQLYH